VVKELNQTHKSKHYCSFISGNLTSDIKSFNHHNNALFGCGNDQDEHFWNAVIRQVLVAGLLYKEIESYGLIKLTEKGENYLLNPTSFMLLKQHDYSSDEDNMHVHASSKGDAFDENLYQLLVDLRKSLSKELDIPPFVIFQEPSLKDMCLQYPINMEELTNIQGVGMGKAQRYGEPFIDLIAHYVEENDIERPQDFTFKSLVNKSVSKVQLIQNIDRRLPLDDIAANQGKSLEDLIHEIESIVNAGTRVNIDYHINNILDEENQDELYDYFQTAETDDLIEAFDEFDGLYSEEEIRLMRIKFMSEMAN
jgi:ATP-dependent DNA helicase RecQ